MYHRHTTPGAGCDIIGCVFAAFMIAVSVGAILLAMIG